MNQHSNIELVLDSTVDMAPWLHDRVHTVPLTISFAEDEYYDGVDINREDFYRKLETSDVLPKTSQAGPEAFEKVFAQLREEGKEGIVITLASAFSGTYQSACIAAQDYPEIRVIDSGSVSIGSGILAEYALNCMDRGMGLDELAAELKRKREDICVLAMLDTLEYLKQGGRISKTAAIAGGILNIKPVCTIKNGEVLILGKARGAKKANNFLVEEIEKNGIDYDLPILLGYSGNSDELLKNYIHDSRRLWEDFREELVCAQICSVIGTHAGPGAVAAAFFRKASK